MLGILKRLFIKLPFYIVAILSLSTLVIPLFYWLITGKSYPNLLDYVDESIDEL